MGKYSLDAFEQYPLMKLRPVMTALGESCYRLVELVQSELEPRRGQLLVPPAEKGQVILRLRLKDTADISDACGFVRRMGSCYEGGRDLLGIEVAVGSFCGAALTELVNAYRQGFDKTFLLAEPGTEQAKVCRREGIHFGLWLPLERGILSLRRSIAQENLARNWERCPVYLYAGRELTLEERNAACRWHSSGADVGAPLGAKMTLRRMMFPKDLTAGGIMPLRMWWQNLGTAPLYHEPQVLLELRSGTQRFPVLVTGNMKRPGLGDTTFNTTAYLPHVPCGIYGLWCGIRSNGEMLFLAMDVPSEEGMYKIGQITLDHVPRPYLATLWEDRYADGYYPLEDTVQPE